MLMTNVLDYLKWRGDLSFQQDPPNQVDALIFSALIYLRLGQEAVSTPDGITLQEAAEEFFSLKDYESRARGKNDLLLFQAAAECVRFRSCRLVLFREEFIPEEDTQFAAGTFLLSDGSMMLAFRGTDNTLVGWKEDFSMSFRQAIPAQLLAQAYTHDVWTCKTAPMRLCGHSKGGNLAVFAAARSSPMIQKYILAVYNNDGPGFSQYMIGDPGYKAIVPRIRTFVPQSSIIGMIMEHEEPYTIVKSIQVGIMQHDLYSWEVLGTNFLPMEEITVDSRFLNRTIRNWLDSMDLAERSQMVDVLFGFLEAGDVTEASEIFHPKKLLAYVKALESDEETRKKIFAIFQDLLSAAKKARAELGVPDKKMPAIEAKLPEQGNVNALPEKTI